MKFASLPILLAVLILFESNNGIAQKIRFQHYTVENGLQNNIVFSATQDAKGLMWFATATGIDRFDGKQFNRYPLPQKNNNYINYIQTPYVLTDYKNQIWAASIGAIYLYNSKKDVFELPILINNWVEKNKSITSVNTIGKNLLVGSNNNFLVYNIETQQLVTSKAINAYIRFVFKDTKGLIWVGTNKGVKKFVINGTDINELKDESLALQSLKNDAVVGISQDAAGRYWIVTVDNGLYIYDEANTSLQPIVLPKTSAKSFAIKDVCHNTTNNLTYVSTDGGGLSIINNTSNEITTVLNNEDDLTSLSNNAVYDIFSDSYNRIWVTTYGGGVNVIQPDIQPFKNFVHEINNANSLRNNAAKAVTQDENGNLWFGTRNGISKLHPITNNWQHFNEENNPNQFKSDNVLFLTTGTANTIWIGTYGGGLININSSNNNAKAYTNSTSDSTTIGSDYIYAVLHDKQQRVWAGGIRGPLSYLNTQSQKFSRIKTSASIINCLIQNSNLNILAGTEKGVYVVQGDSLVNFFPNLVSERVIAILEYEPNIYWIGTLGNGIIIVDKKKNTKKYITNAEGLPADVICGLLKDKNRNVWVGTSRGIAHYQVATSTVTTYTKADGLAGSQINYNAAYQTKDGDLIFGSTDGFSQFNPQKITTKGYRSKIVFTGLTVNNKLIKPNDPESLLQDQIDEVQSLKLKYYQNSISIDFINTSPALSGTHLYSWKLEGFDKDWSLPTAIPTAIYTNLNNGKYTLLVKAFSKGQSTDSEIRKLIIIVTVPWWRTTIAYVAYLLLLLGGILAAYNYYNILSARHKYAERLRLNTGISHEIRTPLTLIKGPVNALVNTRGLSHEQKTNLELAQKNIEKLEKIVSQFIDFQKTGIGKLQMQVQNQNIVALIDDVSSSFIPLMKEKNIHFTYTKPSEPILLLYDKEKIEKVLNNLISNAVKYTPNNKDIAIQIEKEAKYLVIKVEDTGIGIPQNQQHLLFKGYFRADNTMNIKETGSGIGLNVANELVKMHNGKLTFTSQPNKGTTFIVRLPLHNPELNIYLVNTELHEATIPQLNDTDTSAYLHKKILIAEDNDDLRNYLKNELAKAGLKVFTAADGVQALQVIQSQKIDLLITDIMMPEMNGFQLCSAIKKEINTCHIPVIMLTAIHDKDYLLEGYRSGADDYVKKPFDLAYIIARMENLLQNRTRFRNKIMSVFEQEETVVNNDVDIQWLKKATELILENLSEPDFSVEKLSTLMTMSRPVLFRKFKAISGESPQHYINQIRLRKAVELLQQRQLNISQVAFECGFSDPKYFSTAFKKHYGKTPGEYVRGE